MSDALLSPKHLEIQKKARDFAREYIMPVAKELDATGEYPWDIWKRIVDMGWGCMIAPVEYGGPGLDAVSVGLVTEEFAYACLGVMTAIGSNNLSSYPVLLGGQKELQEKYFKDLLAGKIAAFALTEPGAGCDAAACTTTAEKVGDEYILNGTKCFCTGGGVADYLIIFAVTDPDDRKNKLSCFLVEADRPGVTVGSVEDKLGVRASNTTEIILKDVRIPAINLLGNEGDGFKMAMKTLDKARPNVAAQAIGGAQRALDEAIEYVKNRIDANGRPLAKNQIVQFKLADMGMKLEGARQLVRHCQVLKDLEIPYTMTAAMAKALSTDVCVEVACDAVEIMGYYGYSKDSIVEKVMRDAKIQQIYEGTNEVQRIVISGQMLRS